MKKRIGIAALVVLAAVAVGAAVGQPRVHGHGDGHCRGKEMDPKTAAAFKALHQELATWGRANVLPQLRTWKGQLDGAMSADDLRTLNDLRTRAAAVNKEKMALMAQKHAARENDNRAEAKDIREKMKAIHEKRQQIATELKPLAEKYRSTLMAIGEEAKPKAEEWKEEGKKIATNWMNAHKDELGEHPMGGLHHMGRLFGGFKGGRIGKGIAARFMLWDGGDLIEQMQQEMPGMDGDNNPDLR